MKSLLAGVAAVVVAVAAPLGAAQAQPNVTVRVDTPEFGIRIGTPRVIHQPVYVPPPVIYAPAPVYVPPRVVYAPPARVIVPPPRVIVPAPVYYPRHWHGDGHRHGHRHHDHRRDGHRHDHRHHDHRDRDDDRRHRY